MKATIIAILVIASFLAFSFGEIKANVDGIIECDVCKVALTYVETHIGENRTEANIENFLDKACTLIRYDYTKCIAIIKADVPLVIKALQEYQTPTAICTELKAC
eukprot:TRINITY_DN686_c0_g1_i4.p1 TRINITY_DN686_c0_g1~~TRINITY_DN686_c0_g1_i4.p1  ORF type:complete len:121 (+),score=22.44 TRINITY_DN686_c0_g1_i4:50-364(+)